MKWLLSFLFFIISFSANADLLIVNRVANLRQSPDSRSEILEKLAPGDSLLLSEPVKVSGYYRVKSLSSGQQGWVYSAFVRRIGGITPTVVKNTSVNAGVADIRVLDVGAGLCSIIKLPGNKYVIYDAGGDALSPGSRTLAQIQEYVPAGSEIALMVLSHTDADHITAAADVINTYRVKKVLWSGFEKSMLEGGKPTRAYRNLSAALTAHPSTENVNLNQLDSVITPGNKFSIGEAVFTFLCGFGQPLPAWRLNNSEKLNAVSIVMKLEYGGNSMLFCGDAVGRHLKDTDPDALIATEKFMVEKAALLLPSTIILAPHHGAKNGSSRAFVNLVKPRTVIFSAGHNHRHPTLRTATEYMRFVTLDQMFRTDLGDDEGEDEWAIGRITSGSGPYKDKYGDDNIQVQLRSNRTYRVFYIN